MKIFLIVVFLSIAVLIIIEHFLLLISFKKLWARLNKDKGTITTLIGGIQDMSEKIKQLQRKVETKAGYLTADSNINVPMMPKKVVEFTESSQYNQDKTASDLENNAEDVVYARSSLDGTLMLENEYKPGKTIYELHIDRNCANQATLTICRNAYGLILKNDKSLLEYVCDYSGLKRHDGKMEILSQGKAVKDSSGAWKVKEKIKIRFYEH